MPNGILKNGNIVSAVRYAGLATALVLMIWLGYKIITNHIHDNTAALIEVNKTMGEVRGSIEKFNDTTADNTEVLKDLKTFLEIKLK